MRDGRDLSVIFERPTMRDTFRISYLANRLVLPAYNDIKRVYGPQPRRILTPLLPFLYRGVNRTGCCRDDRPSPPTQISRAVIACSTKAI